jgi:hypothetical protein
MEKELAELKTAAAKKQTEEEEEVNMGPGLGGRLMIGGPAGFGGPPNGGMMMQQPTGFY